MLRPNTKGVGLSPELELDLKQHVVKKIGASDLTNESSRGGVGERVG